MGCRLGPSAHAASDARRVRTRLSFAKQARVNSVAVAQTAVQRTEPCVVEVRGSSHGPLLARRHGDLFKGFPRRDRVVMPEASQVLLSEWELSIRTGNSGLFCAGPSKRDLISQQIVY